MEGAWEVRQRFGIVAACCTQPGPAFILSFNLYLIPESLNSPIPFVFEFGHINRTATFFNLFHAVQALSHEAEVAFVFIAAFVVPGALQFVCHVVGEVKLLSFSGMLRC